MNKIYFLFFCFGISQCKLINLTSKDITHIVNEHNLKRLQLVQGTLPGQPPAAEMKSLVWDTELANVAARWVERAIYEHNPNRTLRSGRIFGENIYQLRSTCPYFQFKVEDVFNSWFDEYKIYEYGPVKPSNGRDPSKSTGHYTQMVWSESVYIGCMLAERNENGFRYFFVVCDYAPAGNVPGMAPYKKGRPAGKLISGVEAYQQQNGSHYNNNNSSSRPFSRPVTGNVIGMVPYKKGPPAEKQQQNGSHYNNNNNRPFSRPIMLVLQFLFLYLVLAVTQ